MASPLAVFPHGWTVGSAFAASALPCAANRIARAAKRIRCAVSTEAIGFLYIRYQDADANLAPVELLTSSWRSVFARVCRWLAVLSRSPQSLVPWHPLPPER